MSSWTKTGVLNLGKGGSKYPNFTGLISKRPKDSYKPKVLFCSKKLFLSTLFLKDTFIVEIREDLQITKQYLHIL